MTNLDVSHGRTVSYTHLDVYKRQVWQNLSDLWLPIALAIVGIIILILLIRFIIKKKWAGVVTTVIIAALVVGGGITYRLPHALSNIQADEISKIEVSDVEVTDPALIRCV